MKASELFRRPRRRRLQEHHDSRNIVIFPLAQHNDNNGRESSENTETKEEEEELPNLSATEVANLRSKAAELRAEARAMELELREKASQERQQKDAITDEIIATLFVPLQYQDPQSSSLNNTSSERKAPTGTATIPPELKIIDARVVADRLRQGKFSRQQIMAVVDRLYKLHHDRKKEQAESTSQNMMSDSPSPMEEQKQREGDVFKHEYGDYFQVLTQAAVLLDESIVANSVVEETTNAKAPARETQPTTTASSSSQKSSSPLSSSVRSSSASKVDHPAPSSISQSMLFVTSGKLAKAIQNRISELRQMRQVEMNQRIAAETNRITAMSSSSSSTRETPMRYSGNGILNRTSVTSMWGSSFGETPTFIPIWLPPTHIPYILSMDKLARSSSSSVSPTNNQTSTTPYAIITNSSLGADEVEKLKNDVLLGSRFYLTSYEFAPGAALFRGNIRTSLGKIPSVVPSLENSNRTFFARKPQQAYDNNTAMVFEDIQERLEKAGLGDKIQLFVVPDPEAELERSEMERRPTMSMGMRRPGIDTGSSMSLPEAPKPCILALPKNLTPDESKINKGWLRKIGKSLCYPLAGFSTFLYSFYAFALNPNFYNALVKQRDLSVLSSCVPLALGVVAIQVIHEVSHYLVAKRRKMKIGLPVPVPSFYANVPFFGWITPLRSFPPNRAALVDFALSGPMTALAVSLALVFTGIQLTSRATALQIARFPVVSVASMKSSFLLGSILSWLLPKTMMLPLAQPIPMHPLFVAGASGLITSALNLLPIFRLDGGRACFAAMGQRQGAIVSAFTVLWVISEHFAGAGAPILMFWTILVALFQMRVEAPCRDECTEVGTKRQWLWLTSFLLSLSILIPFPKNGTGV